MVVALAREIDGLRRQDHDRVERFQRSSEPYLRAFRAAGLEGLPLDQAHERLCELAALHLPREVAA